MTGWTVAAVLYALPVLVMFRHFKDEEEDAKDWLRENGHWYPSLAPFMVVIAAFGWPITCIVGIFEKPGGE